MPRGFNILFFEKGECVALLHSPSNSVFDLNGLDFSEHVALVVKVM